MRGFRGRVLKKQEIGKFEIWDHSHLSVDQGGHRRERGERGDGEGRSCPSSATGSGQSHGNSSSQLSQKAQPGRKVGVFSPILVFVTVALNPPRTSLFSFHSSPPPPCLMSPSSPHNVMDPRVVSVRPVRKAPQKCFGSFSIKSMGCCQRTEF